MDEEGLLISRVERHDFNTLNILDMPAHGAYTVSHRMFKKLGTIKSSTVRMVMKFGYVYTVAQ